MREADRFASAGLVGDRRQGNLRFIRARTDNVVAGPLAELLAVTYGPTAVLGEVLASAPGVNEAYVYGSRAAQCTVPVASRCPATGPTARADRELGSG